MRRMRTALVSVIALLSSLALAGGATALPADDGTADPAAAGTVGTDVDEQSETETVDVPDETASADSNFGQMRSAWVQQTKASGERPGPAWMTPGHPTGGPLGAPVDAEPTDDQGAAASETPSDEDKDAEKVEVQEEREAEKAEVQDEREAEKAEVQDEREAEKAEVQDEREAEKAEKAEKAEARDAKNAEDGNGGGNA